MFRRVRIPVNKYLNYIGSSTFMIYLIHENNFVKTLIRSKDWITILYTNVGEFIFEVFFLMFFLFVIGLIAFMVYSCLSLVVIKRKKKYATTDSFES